MPDQMPWEKYAAQQAAYSDLPTGAQVVYSDLPEGATVVSPPNSAGPWDRYATTSPGVGDAIPRGAQIGRPIPAGATMGDPLLRQTKAAAVAGGASPRSTQEPMRLVNPEPTGALGRIASGAEAGARAMIPSFSGPPPDTRDLAMSSFGPLARIAEGVAGGYREARNEGQGVLPSIGSGLGSAIGLDAPGIRERAQRGDVAGVVGEGIPAIASAILLPKAARSTGRTIGAAGDFVDRFSYEHPTEIKIPFGLGKIKYAGPTSKGALGTIGEKPSSLIVQPGTPGAAAPSVRGSFWSFREPALRSAVLSGDRDAAIVYKQRFGELPPGAKYVTDVGTAPNRGLYQSSR